MADQIQVPKLNQHILVGRPASNAAVSKLVMYVFAVPGDSGADTSTRQGHVHSQLIVRN